MKNKVLFIILTFLYVGLSGQSITLESDCPQETVVIYIPAGEPNNDSVSTRHPDILISFWDIYNFVDEEGYSLLIEDPNLEGEGSLITDISIFNDIQTTYNEETTVLNAPCESQKTSSIYLMKNKQLVENAILKWDCNILVTKCGPIDFNSLIFNEKGNKVFFEIEDKIYQSENKLNRSIETAKANDKVLLFNNKKDFVGKVKFILEDGVEELNQLYEDEFYLDIVKDRIDSRKDKRKSEVLLDEQGKILELLLRIKYTQLDFELEKWEVAQENPQNYIVEINYFDESKSLEFDNILLNWEASEYQFTQLKLSEKK